MRRVRWRRYGTGAYKSLLGSIIRELDGRWTWTPPPHIGGLTRNGYRTLAMAQHDAATELGDWLD